MAQVVGVVGDIRHEGLHRDAVSEAYGSFEQSPLATFSLVIRSDRSAGEVSRMLCSTLASVDRDQPLTAPFR